MTTTDASRADAMAWLVGRLYWEQLLDQLRGQAEPADEPVSPAEPAPAAPLAA